MKYIVGFNRDRDGYHVPAALAEGGMLSKLITDYYEGASRYSLRRLSHRSSPFLDPSLVRPVGAALYPQIIHEAKKRLRIPSDFPGRSIDASLAEAIADEWRSRPGDGLLIYSNYAWKAFQIATGVPKVLFQYHPGVQIIRDALAQDELGDARPWLAEVDVVDSERQRVEDLELSLASEAMCASGFTRRGLILDGIAADSVRVVPYGCPPAASPIRDGRDRLILFVGQGVQRKGLHLLATAWKNVRASGWKLRVVASRMDPEIGRILSTDDSIEVSGSVSEDELVRLYESASALVLPSLVEGFGLVLGEALSHGCSLIASTNTGLPDLNLPDSVASVVQPGLVADLSRALEEHIVAAEAGHLVPDLARACADERSWAGFRLGVRSSLPSAGGQGVSDRGA